MAAILTMRTDVTFKAMFVLFAWENDVPLIFTDF